MTERQTESTPPTNFSLPWQKADAANLKELFHSKNWNSLIKLEQRLFESFEKRGKMLNPLLMPLEDFTKQSLYVRGALDVLKQLWRERQEAIESVPKEEGEGHE